MARPGGRRGERTVRPCRSVVGGGHGRAACSGHKRLHIGGGLGTGFAGSQFPFPIVQGMYGSYIRNSSNPQCGQGLSRAGAGAGYAPAGAKASACERRAKVDGPMWRESCELSKNLSAWPWRGGRHCMQTGIPTGFPLGRCPSRKGHGGACQQMGVVYVHVPASGVAEDPPPPVNPTTYSKILRDATYHCYSARVCAQAPAGADGETDACPCPPPGPGRVMSTSLHCNWR